MKSPRILTGLIAAYAVSTFTTATSSAVDFFFNVPNGDWNAAGSWTPAGPPAGGGGNFAYVNNGGTATITADIPLIQDPFIGRGVGNSGTVNHSAGNGNFSSGWMFIGDNGGTGTYNLTGPGNTLGSGSVSTGRIYLGGLRGAGTAGGTGTMNVNTTGTVTAGSDLSVGAQGGTGVLNITAGTVNANSWVIIGESNGGVGGGTGTVVQDGGSFTASATDGNGRFWIGSNEGGAAVTSNGSYTINDGSFTARNVIIGKNYTGTFNQNGGTVTLNNTVNDATDHRLGEAAGATGIYNIGGGTLTVNHNFQIGASGTGVFNQTGGIVNVNNGFPVVGRFVGGTGTLNLTNGSFNNLNSGTQLLVGEEGTGVLNVSSDGNLNLAGNMTLGFMATGNGTANQTGGNLNVAGILDVQGAGTGSYNLDGGTLSVDGSIDGSNGTFAFTGGVLTRSTPGAINYTGNLTIGQSDATLKLEDDKTFAVTGILDITAGITLDVTGLSLPTEGLFVQTGSIPLGTDGSIVGLFNPGSTFLIGLANPASATFISEIDGESLNFDPNFDSVYWVQENAGNVTLNYSVVPEPTALISLLGGIATLVSFQRRRRA